MTGLRSQVMYCQHSLLNSVQHFADFGDLYMRSQNKSEVHNARAPQGRNGFSRKPHWSLR